MNNKIGFMAICLMSMSTLASISVINNTNNSTMEVTLKNLEKNECSTTFSLKSFDPNIGLMIPNVKDGCCINHIFVKGMTGDIINQEINASLNFCLNEKISIFKAGSGDMGLSFADINKPLIRCSKCK